MFKKCFWTTTAKKKFFWKKEVTQNIHSRAVQETSVREGYLLYLWQPETDQLLYYRCPWGSNSSWTTIISTSVATEISVYWSLTRKNNTKIFVVVFFFISSMEHSFLNRKQKTICCPKGGRTKMEMKSHCDILLYSSLSICNHQEWGNWHYSWFKNTEENYKAFSQSSSKNHILFPTQTPHVFLQCSATKPPRSRRRTEQWLVGEHAPLTCILTLLHTFGVRFYDNFLSSAGQAPDLTILVWTSLIPKKECRVPDFSKMTSHQKLTSCQPLQARDHFWTEAKLFCKPPGNKRREQSALTFPKK